MAADIPVKDVLCEAMEYLVKLGSNLRTRSENLKEKKIRKDKLTNSLAVQKAADKVLLICELSKKSLANVESGVRKVLERLNGSQASLSVGGKSSKLKTDESKFYYFDYKSRKLKIRKKISLKHYKSVKVHASKMSFDMLEKYPVYHDCKLYRLRKQKNQAPCDLHLENIHKEPNKSCNVSDKYNESIAIPSQTLEPTDSQDDDKRLVSINSDKIESSLKFPNKNEDFNDSITRKRSYTKKTRLIMSDDSSEDERNLKRKNEQEHVTSCNESESKKRKLGSSGSESKNGNNDEILFLDSDDDPKDESKKSVELINDSERESEQSEESKNDLDESKKPTIKCVSLTKLLRPDVLEKKIEAQPLNKNKNSAGICLKFNVGKKDEMLKAQKKKKDIYLAQKRKDVCSFEPKEFVINISRLPKLCSDFLHKHNLAKVTQGGICICEINEEVDDESDNRPKKTDEKSNNPDAELIAEANKVKTSLLNESDSEDIDTFVKQQDTETTVEKIKNALLNSDSDQNEDYDNHTTSKTKSFANIKQGKEDSSHLDNNEEKNSDRVSKSNKEKRLYGNGNKKSNKRIHPDKNSNSDGEKNSKSDEENKSDIDSNSGEESKSDKKSKSDIDRNLDEDHRDNNENAKSDSKQKDIHKDSEAAKSDLMSKSDDNSENSSNIPEKEHEETPAKESNENMSEAPLVQGTAATPQSEKKLQEETAKKALLSSSNSSDSENEPMKNKLKTIKKSLPDAEIKLNPNKVKKHRSSAESCSSLEDILKKVRKKSDCKKRNKYKRKKRPIYDSNDSNDNKSSDDEVSKLRSRNRKKVRL